ncbi:hypothetical protein ABTY96_47120 [Streptomyces sp. NPDC096057]|uniref:hypothetical protein n=1 Tax=Streptomyces sp. NPDC096057 TaxID=3155543 RepID=UPI00331CA3A6
MLSAEPPASTPGDDRPEPEFPPEDVSVAVADPSVPAGTAPVHGAMTGVDDDAEYEPL